MTTQRKKRGAHDFLWVLVLLIVFFLAVLGRQEYKIYQIKKETLATQQRVEQLQKAKADLEAERKRLDDPKYIEKLAREDHNMVGKNEVPLFIVKDKDKDKAGQDSQTTKK
ncbi:MAG: septum formation initiator family protein [Acidaminococcaceae bacterium]|jgi:cell division protein DivIC|nr:septum formation initiator family protein [Acidaminococcaceae bacterium]